MRKNQTEVERMLWSKLRSERFFGLKFKRQYGIGPYILDFYCREKNIAIELDGSQHLENIAYDNLRTEYLKSFGINVFRFWNNDVMRDIDAVLEYLRITLWLG